MSTAAHIANEVIAVWMRICVYDYGPRAFHVVLIKTYIMMLLCVLRVTNVFILIRRKLCI